MNLIDITKVDGFEKPKSHDYRTDYAILLGSEYCDGHNIHEFIKMDGRKIDFTPIVSTKIIEKLGNLKKDNDSKSIYLGEFPKSVVDKKLYCKLEENYRNNEIRSTEKKYSIFKNLSNRSDELDIFMLDEYEFEDNKYVRLIPDSRLLDKYCEQELSDGSVAEIDKVYWLKVEPVMWIKSLDENYYITKNRIFTASTQNFSYNCKKEIDSTNIEGYLNQIFIWDLFTIDEIVELRNNLEQELIKINPKNDARKIDELSKDASIDKLMIRYIDNYLFRVLVLNVPKYYCDKYVTIEKIESLCKILFKNISNTQIKELSIKYLKQYQKYLNGYQKEDELNKYDDSKEMMVYESFNELLDENFSISIDYVCLLDDKERKVLTRLAPHYYNSNRKNEYIDFQRLENYRREIYEILNKLKNNDIDCYLRYELLELLKLKYCNVTFDKYLALSKLQQRKLLKTFINSTKIDPSSMSSDDYSMSVDRHNINKVKKLENLANKKLIKQFEY